MFAHLSASSLERPTLLQLDAKNNFSLSPQPLTSKRQVLSTYTETVYMTRSCVHLLSLPVCFSSTAALTAFLQCGLTQKCKIIINSVYHLSFSVFGNFSCVNKNKLFFPLSLMLSIHCLREHTKAFVQMPAMPCSATGPVLSTRQCNQGHIMLI